MSSVWCMRQIAIFPTHVCVCVHMQPLNIDSQYNRDTTHGGDQISVFFFWQDKIFGSPDWTVFLSNLLIDGDSRLLPRKLDWIFGESHENLLESSGDSRENLIENLAVVIMLSQISSAPW